jgi:hypothetical protein
MMQEICTKDRLFNIGDYKNPSKCATQTQIQSEGANTICRDLGSIDCFQTEIALLSQTFGTRGRNDAHFCTGVNKESGVTAAIMNVKKATRVG